MTSAKHSALLLAAKSMGLSIVANVALFQIGSLFSFPEDAITPSGGPVRTIPVVVATFIGSGAVCVGWLSLKRLLSAGKAFITLIALACLALAVTAAGPFGIENAPWSQIVLLEVMHVVTLGIPLLMIRQTLKQEA